MPLRLPLLILLGTTTLSGTVLAAPVDLRQRLSAQIARCWNPPPGASGSITMRFDMTPDGHVVGTPKANGLASAGFAADAIHAVQFCQPYRLPPERFSDWQHAVVRLSTGGE